MYRTMVVGYTPKTKEMAKKIEEKANEMEKEGYTLATFSVPPSAKAILLFRREE